jgi:hypothetical protein
MIRFLHPTQQFDEQGRLGVSFSFQVDQAPEMKTAQAVVQTIPSGERSVLLAGKQWWVVMHRWPEVQGAIDRHNHIQAEEAGQMRLF